MSGELVKHLIIAAQRSTLTLILGGMQTLANLLRNCPTSTEPVNMGEALNRCVHSNLGSFYPKCVQDSYSVQDKGSRGARETGVLERRFVEVFSYHQLVR